MAGDEEEARRRRAEWLRRRIGETPEDQLPEEPPRSPHEFIEREMRERAEKEREESEGDPGQDDAPPD